MAGALLADFLDGGDLTLLPDGICAGVAHHRAVDRFTDAHPSFQRSRARLAQVLRLGRGVAVDVLYDHLLARDFERWAGEPLQPFARAAYAGIAEHTAHLTPALRALLPRIAHEDWFSSYATVEGIRAVLHRMQRRMRRPLPLAAAVDAFQADERGFATDFAAFFHELGEMESDPKYPETGGLGSDSNPPIRGRGAAGTG